MLSIAPSARIEARCLQCPGKIRDSFFTFGRLFSGFTQVAYSGYPPVSIPLILILFLFHCEACLCKIFI